jgi:hypothetical protein
MDPSATNPSCPSRVATCGTLLAFPLQSGKPDWRLMVPRCLAALVIPPHYNERARTRPSLVHGLLAQFAPVPMIVER